MQETKNQAVLDKLYELVQTCEDSVKEYQNAAKHLKEGELSTIFYRLSQQRALFREELKSCIRDLGGSDQPDTSFSHTLQRIWIEFKSGLNGNDTDKIINTCEKIERGAVQRYEDALKADPPEYIKEIISKQHTMIKGTFTQLEEFKRNSG
ncbi:ferritin-like domain-containing protein [Negadavirga shengliensis]|uniref:PA2169 family four-helix-bundle protein n=1 Tax=Negadavirga shengliensis TaxID=1389218 RepID=A0ABV9T706_9BACT